MTTPTIAKIIRVSADTGFTKLCYDIPPKGKSTKPKLVQTTCIIPPDQLAGLDVDQLVAKQVELDGEGNFLKFYAELEQKPTVEQVQEEIKQKLKGKHVPTVKRILAWLESQEGIMHHVDTHIAYWLPRLAD